MSSLKKYFLNDQIHIKFQTKPLNIRFIIEKFAPYKETFAPLQISYLAIDKNDFPGHGKKVANTMLEPVKLTLLNKQEIEQVADCYSRTKLLSERIALVCKEAHSQD